jgi:hypothetical protein
MSNTPTFKPTGYCIRGEVGVYSVDGKVGIFPTEKDAQREIAEHQVALIKQFLAGNGDFMTAVSFTKDVVPVRKRRDGSVIDENGEEVVVE